MRNKAVLRLLVKGIAFFMGFTFFFRVYKMLTNQNSPFDARLDRLSTIDVECYELMGDKEVAKYD